MNNNYEIISLPEEDLPAIGELKGDLRLLAEIVGVAKALEVGQVFQDTPIKLWGVKKILRRHRDKDIRQGYDSGLSAAKLARQHGLTERMIWHILGKAEA